MSRLDGEPNGSRRPPLIDQVIRDWRPHSRSVHRRAKMDRDNLFGGSDLQGAIDAADRGDAELTAQHLERARRREHVGVHTAARVMKRGLNNGASEASEALENADEDGMPRTTRREMEALYHRHQRDIGRLDRRYRG